MFCRALVMLCVVVLWPSAAIAQSIEVLAAPDLNLSFAPDTTVTAADPSIFSAEPPMANITTDQAPTDSPDASTSDATSAAPSDAAVPALSVPALSSAEQALLDLTNADRLSRGLIPVKFDPALLPIARARAQAQVGSSTLSHVDGSGALAFVGLLSQAGIQYRLAGENLARVSSSGVNAAQQAEPALMASPTHRANILEPTFRVAAMGMAVDSNGRTVFAEIYRTA
ncbi:MAG TPA: CAP domain-containing protein [Chloroflexota bacterium]|jgi:uncharacterized protein YkwD